MELHDWLSQTTAADVMTRDVVTLNPDDIIAVAAAVMHREQISGCPSSTPRGSASACFRSAIWCAEENAATDLQTVTRTTDFSSGPVFPAGR